MTSIKESTFYDCSSLTSITIPNSVTSIGRNAYTGCSKLTSITIPSSVTSIEYGAFSYCSSLSVITCEAENVPKLGDNVFYKVNTSTGTIYVPKESIDAYKAASGWKGWGQILPLQNTSNIIANGECGTNVEWELDDEGLLRIYGSGKMSDYNGYELVPWCSNRDKIKSVNVENGVTSIGESAFNDCRSLTSISIPNSVTSIGSHAFQNCSDLTSVSIPNSVTTIGTYAFLNCHGITSLMIPYSVTSIGKGAFEACSGIDSITVDSSNPNYCAEENVLFNKDKTELICCAGRKTGEYIIPNTVTSIGEWAFFDCRSLKSVVIPNSVTSIGEWAFFDCRSFKSVVIPNSVTSIGRSAFQGCTDLESVTIPTSVTSIEDQTFYGCYCLTSVDIPNSVTSIGAYAFFLCEGLTSVTISKSVKSIGYGAFYGCSGLTSITIGNSVTSIGRSAFGGCYNLAEITCEAMAVPTLGSDVFGSTKAYAGILFVPKKSVEAYKAAGGWNEWAQILPIAGVMIDDGTDYADIDENAEEEKVTYRRNFNAANVWESLSVPVVFDVKEYSSQFDLAEIYAISPCRDTNGDKKVDEKDDMALIVRVKQTGNAMPNTPYLIRAKSAGGVVIISSDNKIYKEKTRPIVISLVSDIYSFAGVRSAIYINKENEYIVNGSQLESGADYNSTVVPNRWTMNMDSKSSGSYARQMPIYTLGEDVIETTANGKRRFVLIDEATDIDYMYEDAVNSDIYTMDGIMVDDSTSLPAGIYIKNGKKIIIK